MTKCEIRDIMLNCGFIRDELNEMPYKDMFEKDNDKRIIVKYKRDNVIVINFDFEFIFLSYKIEDIKVKEYKDRYVFNIKDYIKIDLAKYDWYDYV